MNMFKKFNNLNTSSYLTDLKAGIIQQVHPLRQSFKNPFKELVYRKCLKHQRIVYLGWENE